MRCNLTTYFSNSINVKNKIEQSLLMKFQHVFYPAKFKAFHTVQDNQHTWSVLTNLYQKECKSAKKKFACYLLNINNESYCHFERYKYIWNEADLRIAVDGSANCLAAKGVIHTADIVSGDFDSIDAKLIEQLRCPSDAQKLCPPNTNYKMPQVVVTPSQRETDFTKAIKVATITRHDLQFHFGLYYSSGDRIDHLFGLINTLHIIKKNIILINIRSNTISWILQAGSHKIIKPPGRELCSLVPFTGPTEAKSHGLEYNLNITHPLQFGGMISTSNICLGTCENLSVSTNRDILWSIDIHVESKREMI